MCSLDYTPQTLLPACAVFAKLSKNREICSLVFLFILSCTRGAQTLFSLWLTLKNISFLTSVRALDTFDKFIESVPSPKPISLAMNYFTLLENILKLTNADSKDFRAVHFGILAARMLDWSFGMGEAARICLRYVLAYVLLFRTSQIRLIALFTLPKRIFARWDCFCFVFGICCAAKKQILTLWGGISPRMSDSDMTTFNPVGILYISGCMDFLKRSWTNANAVVKRLLVEWGGLRYCCETLSDPRQKRQLSWTIWGLDFLWCIS